MNTLSLTIIAVGLVIAIIFIIIGKILKGFEIRDWEMRLDNLIEELANKEEEWN